MGDDMHFQVLSNTASDQLQCSAPDLPTDGTNLVIKVKTDLNLMFQNHCAMCCQLQVTRRITLGRDLIVKYRTLCLQALNLFREKTGETIKLKIGLRKLVPTGN